MCSCLIFPLTSQSKGWRGIVPLVSTRSDVERLLGPCSKGNRASCLYETDKEIVNVNYSDGPCEKGWPFGYNIPTDTVEWIRVSPLTYLHVEELDFKLDTYEKRVNSDASLMYVNNQQGIAVWVFDGKVGSLIYGSTNKQAHLRCPSAVALELPKGTEATDAHSMLYSYGEVEGSEEIEYLSGFAKLLRKEPNTQGYIVTYAGQRSFANEAARRLKCQRNYLIKRQGIDGQRITTIDGGYHPTRRVELYVLLKGGAVPVPFPSVRPSRVEVINENSITANILSPCSDSHRVANY